MMVMGGANLVERPPAFSADGKLLLVCTGCTVSVYSVATGLQVNLLEGHAAPVTSVNVVHSSGAGRSVINHAWTSSLDGTVRFWDFKSGSMIKIITVGSPIISMVIPGLCSPDSVLPAKQVIAFLLVQSESSLHDTNCDKNPKIAANGKKRATRNLSVDGCGYRVILHNLANGKPLKGFLAKVSAPHFLVCSRQGGLVGVADIRKIWVWKVPGKEIQSVNSLLVTVLHHTKALQAVAFDPTETIVAGGDASGRVLLWKNVGERTFASARRELEEGRREEENSNRKDELDTNRGARGQDDAAALSTYHWHADEVTFLMFSVDGAYLFSGGKEAVFVMWQLETGKKQFLPRVGSALLYCASSSDASVFAVSCADNTIRLFNIGTMLVQKTIQGIKPLKELPKSARIFDATKVAVCPGTDSLVLPTEDMSVQFYDGFFDRHIGEIEICPRNYVSVSATKGRKHDTASGNGPLVSVTHVAFSRDGLIMATAEHRTPEDGIGGGSCLKFWKRVATTKLDFIVSTQADEPHAAEISSLAYHPSMDMTVSCCSTGEFKVWVQEENGWRCRSVGAYQGKPMHCASFSPDGTLLAVAANELITLWNPFSNGLVHVLTSIHKKPIKFIYFVPTTHHLVSASSGSRPELTVWSLDTLSICWSYDVEVKGISVEARTGHFAVLVPSQHKMKGRQGYITVFNVASPFPRAVWSVQDVNGCIAFLSTSDATLQVNCDRLHERSSKNDSSKNDSLIYLNQTREYVIFNPFEAEDMLAAVGKNVGKLDQRGLSAFEAVFGRAVESVPNLTSTTKVQAVQPWNKLLNCPSHLISLTRIGVPYLESLLEKRTRDDL